MVLGANIHKLQRMQNTIARVVKLSTSNTGVMDILNDLHWLPVRYRIDFKIATLVYKVRSSSQPVYLSSLISDYALIRSLRSTGTHILHTPRVKTAVGSRAFLSSAPKVWKNGKLANGKVSTDGKLADSTTFNNGTGKLIRF